jgi:hypothetical protein
LEVSDCHLYSHGYVQVSDMVRGVEADDTDVGTVLVFIPGFPFISDQAI